MLKITVSFHKKVPGQEKFSSLSFHSSMERELSDGLSGQEIQNEMHRSYQLLEQTVENEISNYSRQQEQVVPVLPAPVPQVPAKQQTQNAQRKLITQKQISLICSLGGRLKLDQHQLAEIAMQNFGQPTYFELDVKQASKFIELLNAKKQSA